jgi:hypothetical protein
MKKIIAVALFVCVAASAALAQQDVNKDTKVKKTSNVGQKVHNTFSRHKHYNGYKVKSVKHVDGHDVKTKEKVTN